MKDGTPCVLRGATEKDAAEVLRCFSLTHAETDFLLTYPEENSFAEADEAKFLKAREESENEIEICAFVDGKLAGTAGIEAISGKEKIRHRPSRNSGRTLRSPGCSAPSRTGAAPAQRAF